MSALRGEKSSPSEIVVQVDSGFNLFSFYLNG